MSENEDKAAERQPRGHGPGAAMGMPAEKPADFSGGAKRLIGGLKPEWFGLIVVTVLGILSVILAVMGPKYLGDATSLVFEGALGDGINFVALSQTLLFVLALYLGSLTFGLTQGLILNGVVQRSMYRLRSRVEDKIHTLPLSYFDKMSRGELLSRTTNDIDNIMQTLQQTLQQILTAVFTIIGILIMMFLISVEMALVTLISIPLSIVITVLIAKRSQKLFAAQWKHTGELNSQIEEGFSGHALIKVFGRQKEVSAAFQNKNEELYKASFGAQFVSGIIMPAMMFVGNLVYVGLAVVGAVLVANGNLRVGDIQAFIQYSRQFTQPLAQLGSIVNLLQSGIASSERVYELLDEPDQVSDHEPAAVLPPDGAGRIVFENVNFSYSPDKPLIRNLNLTVEPGQTIAIVGPTGAGKTTLVNLIMRFYEIDSGRITLDGVDIKELTREDLRSRTGMVLQDIWLFSGTISENIAYSRPEASEEEIQAAAEQAFVDRFVRTLPEGYATLLDDEASSVSTGERQLITIARAFLARPRVLILDEATSSVDTRTELLLQQAMRALRADRTSFVIAHRLSTIRDADSILYMEQGNIKEQGSHDELMKRNGAYAALYNAQFEAPLDDPDNPTGSIPIIADPDAVIDASVDISADVSAEVENSPQGADDTSPGNSSV